MLSDSGVLEEGYARKMVGVVIEVCSSVCTAVLVHRRAPRGHARNGQAWPTRT